MHAAVNGHASYAELPVIYSAAIQRDLLIRLGARTGRVFKTRTPDVHVAFALTALVDQYHSLGAPLGICGRSGNSTGVARHFCKKGSPVDDEFRRLNAEAGYALHPWVPDLPPIPAAVADAFLWAKQDLFPDDDEVVLDRSGLIRTCLRELEVDTPDEWREAQASCRQALADSPDLLTWFEREYGRLDFTALRPVHRSHHWRHYGEGYLHLDAAEFGVRDIDGAADLCERVLGYKRDGLIFRLEEFDGVKASLSELEEKEAVIRELQSHCEELRAQNERLLRRVNEQDARLPPKHLGGLDGQPEHVDTLRLEGWRGWGRRLANVARRILPR
jgi:hypothetical protein